MVDLRTYAMHAYYRLEQDGRSNEPWMPGETKVTRQLYDEGYFQYPPPVPLNPAKDLDYVHEAVPADIHVITTGWAVSYRTFFPHMPDNVYLAGMTKLIGHLTSSGNTRIILALAPGHPGHDVTHDPRKKSVHFKSKEEFVNFGALENPRGIVGFCVYRPKREADQLAVVVDYCYVLHQFRFNGIAKEMLRRTQPHPVRLGKDCIVGTHGWRLARGARRKYHVFYNEMLKWGGHV